MTRSAHLDPSPFFLVGGPVGVLLIHGFTGSPPEMRLIGDRLHQRGFTISAPLLPGHGTTADDLNGRGWTEWTSHVGAALTALQARCDSAFVAGLSLGSLLTLHLASQRPDVSGGILYSPAVVAANRLIYLTPVLKHFVRKVRKSGKSDLTDPQARLSIWSYEEYPISAAHEALKLMLQVRRLLPRVTCPLLIIHATGDRAIHPKAAAYTYDRVGSADKELVTLHNSGHGLTVDSEWELVADRTHRFISSHLPAGVRVEG